MLNGAMLIYALHRQASMLVPFVWLDLTSPAYTVCTYASKLPSVFDTGIWKKEASGFEDYYCCKDGLTFRFIELSVQAWQVNSVKKLRISYMNAKACFKLISQTCQVDQLWMWNLELLTRFFHVKH